MANLVLPPAKEATELMLRRLVEIGSIPQRLIDELVEAVIRTVTAAEREIYLEVELGNFLPPDRWSMDRHTVIFELNVLLTYLGYVNISIIYHKMDTLIISFELPHLS